ncbi:MAG: hypothetical protein COW65_00935 [Cytophagales bacterium CG18_big_fil_WC_8_21_14_2_50_42_9]|nr:MAG: hypothetical protein COW65_00935 [Cytophagales bacterium CG18_big_fil_WC_8_21_14_2_50_42_9]
MNKINAYFFLLILCSLLSTNLQAQHHRQLTPEQQVARQERMQKIQNAKIAYITEKLNLEPEQAQKFWPVYNQYEKEKNALRYKLRVFRDDNIEAMSEQELREGLNKRLEIKQSEITLEKQYMDNFLKVISSRQLAILYRSEREFTQVLLRKLDTKQPQAGN